MGLSSLTVAWRIAHAYFGTPQWVSEYIGYTAMLCFLAMVGGYAIKLWSSFDLVRAEFNPPIAGNMFGTPLISLLLPPILLADINLPLARIFWVLGTVGMTVFAWFIVNRWMSVRQRVHHTSPAWIIPVVGMINVPLAVPALHLQSMHGLMIFSLAIGLFFAVPLFTLIFSRLMVGRSDAHNVTAVSAVFSRAIRCRLLLVCHDRWKNRCFRRSIAHADAFLVGGSARSSIELGGVLSISRCVVVCKLPASVVV
jgi:tellurite resistance protein TehA-like permease